MAGNKAAKMRKLKKRNRRNGFGPQVCFYCGSSDHSMRDDQLTLEHLLAKSRGGSNDISNLKLAHRSCNQAVGSLSVESKLKLAGAMKRGELPDWALKEVRRQHLTQPRDDLPMPSWLRKIIEAADQNPRWAAAIAEAPDEKFVEYTSRD